MIKLKKNNSEEIKALENEIKTNNESAENKTSEVNDLNNTDSGKNTSEDKGSAEINKLKEELEKKTKEIETLTDTMKRRQADFENYKKRMIKTQEEQKKFAIKDFALDIITVNDDLLRAFEASCSIDKGKSVEEICNTFSDGFTMISKKVEEVLKKYGIDEINSLNQAFDPSCNEAIEMEDSENISCDTITKVHQKGYRMDEFVLRTAKVKVSKPKKTENNASSVESNDSKNEAANDDVKETSQAGENINFKA